MSRYSDMSADLCSQPEEPLLSRAPGSDVRQLGPGWWFTPILVLGLIAAAGAAMLRAGIPAQAPLQPIAAVVPEPANTQAASHMVRGGLRRNHPSIQAVLGGSSSFMVKAEKRANARPHDIRAWDLFGDLALQASAFDLTYSEKAEKAYEHALRIDPNDPRALKGLGNVDYDRHRYDAATSEYEHYLRVGPNDPKVLTDLGTMYLARQNIDAALKLYDRALALEPDLFAARFNAGVAYLLRGDKVRAVDNLERADKLAPDASARLKVEMMMARLEGRTYASTATAPSDQKPAATFRDAVERIVRTLPSEGSKVRSVEWPSQFKAVVVVSDFPAGIIPAGEKKRLLENLKAGIITAKVAHRVSGAVEIDLRDAASGRTVATVID